MASTSVPLSSTEASTCREHDTHTSEGQKTMYKHHSTWILVMTVVLFALPALAADEVVPATSEDIEAFDKALTRTRQQERMCR